MLEGLQNGAAAPAAKVSKSSAEANHEKSERTTTPSKLLLFERKSDALALFLQKLFESRDLQKLLRINAEN